jgi:hypothetical protein
MIPKKLLILQKLTDHLKGITPDNGYQMDVSANVYRGRSVFGSSDPVPAISILEFPKPDVGVFGGSERHAHLEEWMLLVQGWAKNDNANPTDPAYILAASVQQRLYDLIAVSPHSGFPVNPDLFLLGGLVTGLSIGPYSVRPPDNQVSSTAYIFLPLRVGVQTDVSQPFVEA